MDQETHRRGQSDADTLADAKAMLAAAQADKGVAKELGATYLHHVHDDVAHGEAALAEKPAKLGAAHEEGSRVNTLTTNLIASLSTIRDRGKLAGVSPAKLETLGVGQSWNADQPDAVASAARAVVATLDADHALATQVHATPQVRHDLEHGIAAIEEAHQHHLGLRAGNHTATTARLMVFAALRADAHHIRLAAHVLYPHDPGKQAAFQSPVPRHVVTHRTPPA